MGCAKDASLKSCELRVASCELRVASCELQLRVAVASCELRVVSCELRVGFSLCLPCISTISGIFFT